MTKPAYMYIQSEPRLWTVGFESDGRWEPESDHESPEAAERRVEILNAPTLAYELRELRAENEELREYGLQAASELGTLSAENERLRAERDDAIDAEKIALREIGAEIERLRAVNSALEGEAQNLLAIYKGALVEIERLRAALAEYVTGCHACLGTGTTPGVVGQPSTYGHPCLECAPAKAALAGPKDG